MKRLFSWMMGRGSKTSQRNSRRGSLRPTIEGLEPRLAMASVGIEYDSFYEVPVLVIRGDAVADEVVVSISDRVNDRSLDVTHRVNGALQKPKSFDLGTFFPGYILFKGYGGDDSFRNNTSLPSLMEGGEGDDTLIGGSSVDRILGGYGSDTIQGRDGGDIISGGWEKPTEADVDFANGGPGRDHILMASSKSYAYGGSESDYIEGHNGVDTFFGEGGVDILLGRGGVDFLNGGADDDRLAGGLDGLVDQISGGTGRDTFHRDGDAADLEERLKDMTAEDRIGNPNGIPTENPRLSLWVEAVQAAHANGNAQHYDRVSFGLTIDAGIHDPMLAEELHISAVHLTEPVEALDNYFADRALHEFSPAAVAAGDSWLDDADPAAIHDAALAAVLAELAPSINDNELGEPIESADVLPIGPQFVTLEDFDFMFLLASGLFGETATVIEGNYIEFIPVSHNLLNAEEALPVEDTAPLESTDGLLIQVWLVELNVGNYYEENALPPIEPITAWLSHEPLLGYSSTNVVFIGLTNLW